MKKIYITLSNLIMLLLVINVINFSSEIFTFSQYPGVQIINFDQNIQRAKFESELQDFALQHGILIGRRIVEPNKSGQTKFTYALYGNKELPHEIIKANNESIQNSDLAASYLVFEGASSLSTLKEYFEEYGANAIVIPATSSFQNAKNLYLHSSVIITLAILLLTYFSLTLIQIIKKAKEIAIKRISGATTKKIYHQLIYHDIRYVIIMIFITTCLSGLLLKIIEHSTWYLFSITFYSLLIFNSIILFLNLCLSLILYIYTDQYRLFSIIKGKLPYRFLLIFMLFGQVFSVFILGYTIDQSLTLADSLHTLRKASNKWEGNAELFDIKFGLAPLMNSSKHNKQSFKKWYSFTQEALNEQDAFFIKVQNNGLEVNEFSDPAPIQDANLFNKVIFVSPNYVKREKFDLSEERIERFNHLSLGEFGLIIPRELQDSKNQIENYFMDYLTTFSREGVENDSKILYDVKPITFFSDRLNSVFLYNTENFSKDTVSNQQYLSQPIIVVMSPESTGNTLPSYMHWMINAAKNIKYTGYDETISLLKKYDLYSKISYLVNSRQTYLEKMTNYKTNLVTHLFASFFACLSSLLLFICMNQVYFNQFRRDILIKRISGLNFWQNHQVYLALQLMIFIIAFGLSMILAKHKVSVLINIIIFLLIALLSLVFQVKKENRQSLTLLKGA
ncbi:DUF1430 domain-containing protein [Facklamia sp. P12955]|uniref:DUF1430 domain-containing protein n=1 Tax=Facklamia sp. P12955 TaxID=3421946 RepID=UPI003D17B146